MDYKPDVMFYKIDGELIRLMQWLMEALWFMGTFEAYEGVYAYKMNMKAYMISAGMHEI